MQKDEENKAEELKQQAEKEKIFQKLYEEEKKLE